jgi:hypothetical protein
MTDNEDASRVNATLNEPLRSLMIAAALAVDTALRPK